MAAESSVVGSVRRFLRMVRFEHTIFGIPFVLMAGVMAAGGLPSARTLFWMIMAAVGARNFAMTLNRFADRDIDPRNPRTQGRAEFQPLLRSNAVLAVMAGFLALFILSARMLNPLAFTLSFAAAACIVVYSYAKRFTSWTHLILGAALGCAPAGAWVAVRGEVSLVSVLLFAGVAVWVAGFDLIYACLDADFDEAEGLYSLPRLLGVRRSLLLAAALHIGAMAFFIAAGRAFGLGALYWLGLAAAGCLLFREHRIARPDDLSRVDLSFFNLNAWVSVVISAGAMADVLLGAG